VADRLGISASRLRQVNGLSPRARIGTGYTLIVPSESEGDRITLSNLLPNRPQPGAVEPPPPRALIQRTTVRGKSGRTVVIERKVPVSAARRQPAAVARARQTPRRQPGARRLPGPSPGQRPAGTGQTSGAGKEAALIYPQ
jgi:hypothetical protein